VNVAKRHDAGKGMKRAMMIGVIAIVALLLLTYVGDYCSLHYQIPGGRPQYGQITVNILYVIHVKGGKIQYEPGPQETDTCVHSLFPQYGCSPCWYLSRHTDKLIDI
jgi:hypothetical protein